MGKCPGCGGKTDLAEELCTTCLTLDQTQAITVRDLARLQPRMIIEITRQVKARVEEDLGDVLVTYKTMAKAVRDTEQRCDRVLAEQRQRHAIERSKFKSEMLEEMHKHRDEVRAQVAELLSDARNKTILEGAGQS